MSNIEEHSDTVLIRDFVNPDELPVGPAEDVVVVDPLEEENE